ncbi:double zinc ribbon domain-containing protein [Marinobacterium stanieri]|uniref:Double zinc ribbon n=1 Tax=Marinobacterium stanieri TaxID=49186 RepID=A0A1N6QCQ9_9GAMM|nr:Double zinc ribbon [Marinobacterium stanieri]
MSNKQCPKCGASNSPLAVHCSACGSHLSGNAAKAGSDPAAKPTGQEAPATKPNNLTECPDCGNQVSLKATSCPHCGAPRETARAVGKDSISQPQNFKQAEAQSNSVPTFGQRVIAAILAVVLFTHGYFLLRYKALTPCEAAARKVVVDIVSDGEEGPVTQAEAMGAAFATKYIGLPAARLAMSTESTAGCYAIALGLKGYRD